MKTAMRIGIAGLGRIGWHFHAQRLAKSADFTIAAVSDPLPERLSEAEAAFSCVGYTDFGAMIAEAKLDALVIATPTHLHKEMALTAFKAGLHVLMEKPLAVGATESAAIVRAAERYGRVLTVYQPHRLAAYFQQVRRVLESGAIGRITRVQLGMFSFSRRDDWQSLRKFGGGMLNNYGAHGLDQLLQLIGYDVKRLFCSLQTVATLGDADDVVKILLETRKGVLGELDISQASGINPYKLNVWGTHGGVTMTDTKTVKVRSYDPASLGPKKVNRSLASTGRKYPSEPVAWQEQEIAVDGALELDVHANFAAAIRGEAELAVPPRETLALMKLLDKLREDAGRIHDFR